VTVSLSYYKTTTSPSPLLTECCDSLVIFPVVRFMRNACIILWDFEHDFERSKGVFFVVLELAGKVLDQCAGWTG
jgi:hypothetical protein